MIWHLAVHPDHRRRGIGGALLAEATRRAATGGDEGPVRASSSVCPLRAGHYKAR
ncbi:MAG: GNAT family N-acetyltransferase [Bacillota bacterium]